MCVVILVMSLGVVTCWRRFLGGSRVSQGHANIGCERMRAAEHAPSDPFHVLERRHSLAEIFERGAVVVVN